MRITGVSTIKDEPEFGDILSHMVRQGVTDFCVSCDGDIPEWRNPTDESTTLYWRSCAEPFDQGAEITRLAHFAASGGSDWIIPFDADEYWVGTGGTIREVLEAVPPQITVIHAAMYLHLDMTRRHVHQKPLGKVAARPADDLVIHWGSHGTNRQGEALHGVLQVRELQYRDWDHFRAKVEKARQLHTQPHMANSPHGTHMERLTHLTENQLWERWQEHLAVPTIDDPIP